MRKTDITGQKFKYLTAIKEVSNDNGKNMWLFSCVCGKEIVRLKSRVTVKNSQANCGCIIRKKVVNNKLKCISCCEYKDVSEFRFEKHKNQYLGKCNLCQKKYLRDRYKNNIGGTKDYGLLFRYGIDYNQYEELKIKQNNLCLICKIKTELCVDHCHKSKEIRGLLCKSCNMGIGHFKDNVDFLQNAVYYLNNWRKHK